MKRIRDWLLAAACVAVLPLVYADRQQADEASAARDHAALQMKVDR